MPAPWRVAVTRDEGPDGPLSRALREAGFVTSLCRVAEEHPPADPAPLEAAARDLERYDWAVFASRRAVTAIVAARGRPWPRGLRTAAVGTSTAAALVDAGADPAPVVAAEAGADPLWNALTDRDQWAGRRVLVPAIAGGRRRIIDGLRGAGADVTVVEAYQMHPRPASRILADWRAATPEAVIIASPSAADLLVHAVGRDALASLRAVVAIGPTTAAALEAQGITPVVSPASEFTAVARCLAELSASGGAPNRPDHAPNRPDHAPNRPDHG